VPAPRPIAGQVALITGAARGIGAETARQLAARGARVSLVGLEPEELERAAAACGPEAAWYEADITDWDALERAVEGTVERFGAIDVVMANAGVGAGGTVEASDPRAFERLVEINLLGTWRTVRTALPHVIDRRGYVLIVGSLASGLHAPGMAAYSASKAGVEAFANSLRGEVAPRGVDVGVAYFPWIDTDMVRGGEKHPAFQETRGRLPGPLGKTYPVSVAGKVAVEGIEHRRRTVAQGWVKALMLARTVVQPLSEIGARAEAEKYLDLHESDVAARGAEAVSAPVGPGGEAAMRAAGDRRSSPSG
jgi:NAD(P)-dependent dehydrogenase (short-subunit alcohol dehydrogenase family)